VLERHRLAVAAQDRTGRLKVLGNLPEPARRTFRLLADAGPSGPDALAARLALAPEVVRGALEVLREHRVVREEGGSYRALRGA